MSSKPVPFGITRFPTAVSRPARRRAAPCAHRVRSPRRPRSPPLDGYCLSRRPRGMPEDTFGAAIPVFIPGTCSANRSCPISLVGWPHREPRYTPRCRTRNNSVPRGKRSPGGPQTRTWRAAGDLGHHPAHHPALDSQQPSAYVRFSVLRMTRCPAWDGDLSRPTRHLIGQVFPCGPLGMPVRLITRAAPPSSRHGWLSPKGSWVGAGHGRAGCPWLLTWSFT